jgi:DNA-binding LytR/AlgR family response regulator
MLRVAICDDDNNIINELEKILNQIVVSKGIYIDIDSFSDGSRLINYIGINGQCYDIIFLDIEMNEMNGLQTAEKIRETDEFVYIIYITCHENYALEAFDVHPYQFILKPFDEIIIEKYFFSIYEKIISGEFFYNFKSHKDFYRVPLKDIIYFDSKRRLINVHMYDGTIYTYYDKLNDVEKKLKNSKLDFWRIHQSILVNTLYIRHKSFDSITLMDGEKYYISEDRRKHINELYIKLVEENMNER